MPSRLSYVWLSLKRGLGSRTAAEVLMLRLWRRCSPPTGRH
ncbi:MAG: hypothetical protein ACLSGI_01845 [Butyricicoccaceae bacterium]